MENIEYQTEPYTDKEILEHLHPFVREWFTSKFESFSPPQTFSIRNIQQGVNSLISSPTGSGKCITPDTTLLIQERGYAKLLTGQELIEKTRGTPVVASVEETGKLHAVPHIESFSFNGYSLDNEHAMVYHEDYEGEVIHFKTLYGREVTVSPEHPLLVEREDGSYWVPAQDIKEGDRLGVPRRIYLPEHEIELPWREAIQHTKKTAKHVVDYETYTRLKEKTNNFSHFNITTEEYYLLQLLTREPLVQLAQKAGIGLTTIHRLFQRTTRHGQESVHTLFRQIKNTPFLEQQLIVQGHDGKISSFTFPTHVNECVARWTAFVTAEGHIADHQRGAFISVSQKNRPELLKQFFTDTHTLFSLDFKRKNDIDYTLHATYATRFIRKLFGITAGKGRTVDLPQWLLNCSQASKREFLRVFFSLEAEARKNEVRLTQASKQKIEMLNYLLLSFDIFCSLGTTEKYASNTEAKRRRTYHTITVRGIDNLSAFLHLDMSHPATHSIEHYCTGKPSGKRIQKHVFNTNNINKLSKEFSSRKAFEQELGTVYEVVRRTGYITEDAIKKTIPTAIASGDQQLLLDLTTKTAANLMWLEVKEKNVKHYQGKLVDLSVPGPENFVGGYGGMYLHNTLSAFLAIINELVTKADLGQLEDNVYCVYLSPLKALANDINKNLTEPLKEITEIAKKYNRKLAIRVGTRTGDTTPSQKAKMLKKAPHILITTPESLAIMLTTIKFSELMKTTQYVIVDEIHALAENKRGTHMTLSIERLNRRATFTRIGLSATVAPLEEVAKFLVGYENGEPRPCKIIDVNKLASPEDAVGEKGFVKKLDLKVLSPVPNLMDASHTKMQHEMYHLIHNLIQQHRSTLIFTNTRAGTERVVHQLRSRYPQHYNNILDADEEGDTLVAAEGQEHEHLAEEAEIPDEITAKEFIGAHHGSLAKKHRLKIENMLKAGELKCVVCSTSLELGIDIGYIDLVILLGSPKSVARALQRIGRSGHKLHARAKGRIIVLDRDDLVECSVLLKSALSGKIDRLKMPRNCLDVLAQQLFGIAIEQVTNVEDAWELVRSAYPFHELPRKDFDATMQYLAGAYKDLEERNIYAKIWMENGEFGKRGKLARLIFMTNVGTIPDETAVRVKIQDLTIGSITEEFAEKLRPGDVFVLGGEPYEFRFSRGMTAQVRTSAGRLPTVPSWVSEMLPLNYDLACEIQLYRKYVAQLFEENTPELKTKAWIADYLPVDEHAVESLYQYGREQHAYSMIPHRNRLLIEHFKDGNKKYVFVHALYGRRTADVLARALAYVNGKITGRDVEIGITDNGFYLKSTQPIQALRAFKLMKPEELYLLMELALEKSEVLRRRFRHCATRGMMILKKYKGNEKSVGKQQLSSQIIMSTLKKIDPQFPILKEARREILEDLMDIAHAKQIVEEISKGQITLEEHAGDLPSPFAFNMLMQGYTDLLKIEDRVEFVRRLHKMVLREIGGEKVEKEELLHTPDVMYQHLWDKQMEEARLKQEDEQAYLLKLLDHAARKTKLQPEFREYIQNMIRGEKRTYPPSFNEWLDMFLAGTIPRAWADDLVRFIRRRYDGP